MESNLSTLQSYLAYFKNEEPKNVAKAWMGVASKEVVAATRNGGRVPALQNAGKIANELSVLAPLFAQWDETTQLMAISKIAAARDALNVVLAGLEAKVGQTAKAK